MSASPIQQDLAEHSLALDARWRLLCKRYLPLIYPGSIWRFSREPTSSDPEQGWKLHLSATILSAPVVLRAVGGFLTKHQVLFKGPKSLDELSNLNMGLGYGYSQIGKFLTIYPKSDEETKILAARLHRLTRGFPCPSIPFDFRYKPESCVFYRYGAFKAICNDDSENLRSVIRRPDGVLVPDERETLQPPDWVSNPFAQDSQPSRRVDDTPLKTTFRAFRALSQRGKGGVYQAVDLSVTPPRLAVLKEGRAQGELGWDGRDGFWRVKHEEHVLRSLRSAGINVPDIYSSFIAEGNQYLVLEFIEGGSFENFLIRRRRRLRLITSLEYALSIAQMIARIHRVGWVWRDCKPRNLILTKSGELRPIDFEGACRIDTPDQEHWGTLGYVPPEWNRPDGLGCRLEQDLYALGASIFMLIYGRPPETPQGKFEKSRRGVPIGVLNLVRQLLSDEPTERPSAATVVARLKVELNELGNFKNSVATTAR